jgi:FkbM family methyltransferase
MFISKSAILAGVKSTFQAMGLEISFARSAPTERNILRSIFNGRRFDFVVDVGANTGQYGRLIRRCGHHGLIVSFEPLSAAHEALLSRAGGDENWTVAEKCALGAATARGTINVSKNSVSSSLLDVNSQHIDAAPRSEVVGTEEIRVLALDQCIESYVGEKKNGLLKIDTQGYEMEVLQGAHRTLSEKVDLVQTELSLIELYDGQPLMLDVCNFLSRYGFKLRYVIPGFKDPVSGKPLQLDGIFEKN